MTCLHENAWGDNSRFESTFGPHGSFRLDLPCKHGLTAYLCPIRQYDHFIILSILSAEADNDYVPVSEDVMFSENQPMQCVSVQILHDSISEDFESFTVFLAESDKSPNRVYNGSWLYLHPNFTTVFIEGNSTLTWDM